MSHMHTGFVDRMLCLVDGAVAPVWISQVIHTHDAIDPRALESALDALLARVPRLCARWEGGWRARPTAARALLDERAVDELAVASAACFAAGIDLARDPPLRVTILRAKQASRVVIQLHHGLGDARALMFVNRALWGLYQGEAPALPAPPALSDRRALSAVARDAKAWPTLLQGRHRVLARRGAALRRDGPTVGVPMLRTLRIPLAAARVPAAQVFYSTLLAAVRAHGVVGVGRPVRLRVPIDLRRELRLGDTLENACTALSIELAPETLHRDDPALVTTRIAGDLRRGVHHATLLEVLLAGRLASREALRAHAAPDLTADVRANTLVATYVGSLDRYLHRLPWRLDAMQTHTSTWGANAFSLRGALHVNFTAFEGLWSSATLDAFAEHAARHARDRLGLPSEILP